MLRNENTFASFIDALCPWLDASDFIYRLESNDDDNTDLYKIQFDMDKKWSLHFKTRMQFVFEQYNIKNAEAEMANNTVILKTKRFIRKKYISNLLLYIYIIFIEIR
jgi:hypothetical protein